MQTESNQWSRFAQLAKYDESTGYFEAVAASESLDKSGEIFDFAKSRPHFEAWSATISKASNGKSVGNVREMHGSVAAGKLTEMVCDDVEKCIRVAGFAVDPVTKTKLASGVLTGVSIGGSYGEKWPDNVMKGARRYEAIPTEISLVDNPCNPDAHFTLVKNGGAEEMRKFDAPAAAEAVAVEPEAVAEPAVEPVAAVESDPAPVAVDEPVEAVAEPVVADEPAEPAEVLALAASGDLAKAADDLAKATDSLQKVTAERDDLAKKLETVTIQYAELLTKAAPPKGVLRVVSKDADVADASLQKLDDSPVLHKDGSIDHAETALKLMKLVHRR